MSTLDIWLTIFGMTIVTIVTRALFLMVGDRLTLPMRVQHALRFAPAAALAAGTTAVSTPAGPIRA